MSNPAETFREIVPIAIEQEMKSSYLDYAMSVIVSRAIPDVRDGLKPVHRRILHAMNEAGYHHNKAHRKSARIVGDVIGKYHPHGDVAVYDSLVRMAQEFSLRLPLIDGQGNFGSIDGDSPAAMRYTESRLAKVADKLLLDIDKETVDFQPNYDGSESEPKVLPAMFPNLLVNGAGGIAVGMATNIPPHNLGELVDACCMYVDDPSVTTADMMQFVKGPDFPTKGMILGSAGIKSALETGRGSVMMRGRAVIEDMDNGQQVIIITEIPYAVNKAKLVEKIADLVREKRIEGISDLRDESDRFGIRVVVELKKGTCAEVLLNQLYSYTPLQTSFGVNMLALCDGMPRVMNLKDVISAFVRFREEVITKRSIYLLNKARDKAHLLVGLGVAVRNIDEVIEIIKAAKDPIEAKERLMERKWDIAEIVDLIKLVDDKTTIVEDRFCYFTEAQTKAILDMRLHRLTNMEKDKISGDLNDLAVEISGYLGILGSRARLLEVLKEELIAVKDEFATPRKTEICFGEFEQDMEDLIPREDMVVTVTVEGYIKRVPLSTYRAQRRGGKGRSGGVMREDDAITQIFVGVTHTPMLFFSNLGQVYRLKLYKLPLGGPQNKGRPIVNLLSLKEGESITTIMPLPEDENLWDDLNIMFSTAKGNVRRNDLSDFKRINVSGKIAIRLDEDDSLVDVRVCDDSDHVLLASRAGKCIRFPVSSVRVFKSRTSDGVRGMDLETGDQVIGMMVLRGAEFKSEGRDEYLKIPVEIRKQIKNLDEFSGLLTGIECALDHATIKQMAENEDFILTVSENGYGKCTSAYEYRVTNRGGKGIANMVISEKNGPVISNMPVKDGEQLMLITNLGKLIRCPIDTVRVTSRNTIGVILFRTAEGEQVVSAALIAESEEEEGEGEGLDVASTSEGEAPISSM
jgi:DNA gyrase subunit A